MIISTVLCEVENSLGLRISGELGSGDSIRHVVNHYCDFFKVSVFLFGVGPSYMLFKFSKPYVEGYVLEACTGIAKNLGAELEMS
ncbi:MAG: hypothetical protein PHF86_06270 [Candidatus Nanoarchaeia archaeon]|nr:hypothetical protein [Candidatus Nanoarchaeia archaeon]